jgi:hypothetical protein
MQDELLTKINACNLDEIVAHERLPDGEGLKLLQDRGCCHLDLSKLVQRHEIEDVEPEALLDGLFYLDIFMSCLKGELEMFEFLHFQLDCVKLVLH